jgi:hypothetical protein
MMKPFDAVRRKYLGPPSTSFGMKRYECQCGKKVRYVAIVNNVRVCRHCYKDFRTAHR